MARQPPFHDCAIQRRLVAILPIPDNDQHNIGSSLNQRWENIENSVKTLLFMQSTEKKQPTTSPHIWIPLSEPGRQNIGLVSWSICAERYDHAFRIGWNGIRCQTLLLPCRENDSAGGRDIRTLNGPKISRFSPTLHSQRIWIKHTMRHQHKWLRLLNAFQTDRVIDWMPERVYMNDVRRSDSLSDQPSRLHISKKFRPRQEFSRGDRVEPSNEMLFVSLLAEKRGGDYFRCVTDVI